MSRNALSLFSTLAALTALLGTGPAGAGEAPAAKAPIPLPAPGLKLEAPAPVKKVEVGSTAVKAPVSNPKAIEVVNRYVEALGGTKVLESINDRTTKFRVIKHQANGETKALMNL